MDKRQPEDVKPPEPKPLNEQRETIGKVQAGQSTGFISGTDRTQMIQTKRDMLLACFERESNRCMDRLNELRQWRDRVRFANCDTVLAFWESVYGGDVSPLVNILLPKY